MSIVRNGDAICLAVVGDAMDAGHFIAANGIDAQLVGCYVLRAFHCSISFMKFAQYPIGFAVKARHNIFGQRDGSTAGRIEFMDVMHLFHTHPIARISVHDTS